MTHTDSNAVTCQFSLCQARLLCGTTLLLFPNSRLPACQAVQTRYARFCMLKNVTNQFKILNDTNFRIKPNFRIRFNFHIKPNLRIRFDFSVKADFRIRFDFHMKPNFRSRFNFSIKPVFEKRLSIQLYSRQ